MAEVMINGWAVTDKSYVTKGSDPTQVFSVELRKDGKKAVCSEFFNDYTVILTSPGSYYDSPRTLTRKEASDLLVRQGCPSLNEIEHALDTSDHMGDWHGRNY